MRVFWEHVAEFGASSAGKATCAIIIGCAVYLLTVEFFRWDERRRADEWDRIHSPPAAEIFPPPVDQPRGRDEPRDEILISRKTPATP